MMQCSGKVKYSRVLPAGGGGEPSVGRMLTCAHIAQAGALGYENCVPSCGADEKPVERMEGNSEQRQATSRQAEENQADARHASRQTYG
jgi:hypothetical protein